MCFTFFCSIFVKKKNNIMADTNSVELKQLNKSVDKLSFTINDIKSSFTKNNNDTNKALRDLTEAIKLLADKVSTQNQLMQHGTT